MQRRSLPAAVLVVRGRAAGRDEESRLRRSPSQGHAADAHVHRREHDRTVASARLLLRAQPAPGAGSRVDRRSADAVHARARPRTSVRRGPAPARRGRARNRPHAELPGFERVRGLCARASAGRHAVWHGAAERFRDPHPRRLGRPEYAAAGSPGAARERAAPGRPVGDLPERRVAKGAHHRPVSVRALVPGPLPLRRFPDGPVLRGGALADGAGRGDRCDRHGAPV